jgi:hypothetical protein
MAMGNKGIEIERYAFLARNQSGLLLAEAYELVDAAANDATLDDRGLASARSTFAASRDRLKIAYSEWATDLATLRQRIPTERPRTLTEARHHDFATEHGLYLNLCIHDWPCSEKYTDSLFFGYIAPTNDPYVFNRLARYFNQAKEDYAIARYLIVEALHPTPSRQRVSEKTQYADLLEYADYGLNAGLLKTAFIAAYNILDKIAVFLKWELALPEGESLVSFRRIWYPNRRATNLRTEFMRKDDSNLYALYDIAIDLGKEDLHHLNTVRHAITHRHLVVHEWFLMVGEHSDENEHILFDDLVGYGVEILQLIKAALIYLASYLNQEHSRKMKESQGFVAPMPFYWQSDQ